MRMLDLFSGRWGWSKAFAARGWECVGIDLVAPPDIPEGCTFIQRDILTMTPADVRGFDFICASSPCEQFSVHGMRHFHPNPKFPALGLQLFNHTRMLCEVSGVPYVMENVRATQEFVGNATQHCGPFYLWGSGVPPMMPQGIQKGMKRGDSKLIKMMDREERRVYRNANSGPGRDGFSSSKVRIDETARAATIPPELANCVADYAERILERERVA